MDDGAVQVMGGYSPLSNTHSHTEYEDTRVLQFQMSNQVVEVRSAVEEENRRLHRRICMRAERAVIVHDGIPGRAQSIVIIVLCLCSSLGGSAIVDSPISARLNLPDKGQRLLPWPLIPHAA